ncbi:HlyD family efflux transporter periplasmic adaptor subunit [Gimesia sp.]|uniref:HlyD family efflux transporter periplasmic adaptor subunit n=1 Tax=Gimesia sp. TaxID=2024833 RepID=UPI003A8E1004
MAALIPPSTDDFLESLEETERIEEEQSPLSETLEAMPIWISRGVLYLCILFVIVSLLFACLGRVDEVANAPAVITPQGRLKPIQTDLEGIVTELLVKEGEQVTANQPLARIDSADVVKILSEVRTAERSLEAVQRELNEAIPLKQRQTESQTAIQQQKIASQEQRQQALQLQIASENRALELLRELHVINQKQQQEKLIRLQLDRKFAKAQADRQEEQLASVMQLVKQSAASRSDLRGAQEKYDTASAALAKVESQINETENDSRLQEVTLQTRINEREKAIAAIKVLIAENAVATRQAELEIRRLTGDLETQKLNTQHKHDALKVQLTQSQKQARLNLSGMSPELIRRFTNGEFEETDEHLVLAPIDGTVGQIHVTDGEAARRGTTLITLIPEGATLVAEVKIPNREVGKVRESMQARFKFDAFPYARHGAITGELNQLVKVAEASRSQSGSSGTGSAAGSGTYYRGYCTLDQTYFRVDGTRKPLLPGMTATAEIVTGRKRIIEVLLQPLLAFQQGKKAEE